jgi:hypothetical protein
VTVRLDVVRAELIDDEDDDEPRRVGSGLNLADRARSGAAAEDYSR